SLCAENIFDEAALEEDAEGGGFARRINRHGIALAVVQQEVGILVDFVAATGRLPDHRARNHGLDRKAALEIGDVISASAAAQDRVLRAENAAAGIEEDAVIACGFHCFGPRGGILPRLVEKGPF